MHRDTRTGFGCVLSVLADVETIQNWVNEFGYMVVYDEELLKKDASTAGLVNTWSEILQVSSASGRPSFHLTHRV